MNSSQRPRRHRRALAACVGLALAAAACGSDDDDAVVTSPTPAPNAPTTASEATTAVTEGPVESTPAATEPEASGPESAPPDTEAMEMTTAPPESVATTEDDSEVPVGGELTVIQLTNPSSLDPVLSASGGDPITLQPIFDRLINYDGATLAPIPGLAESWDFPDPQTLVLTLRTGIEFHDGTPFDAEAVKYNLDRALTFEGSTAVSQLTMIDSVEVTGPSEVTIHLNRQDSSILLTLANQPGMMGSPAAIEELGADFATNPVGTGAFIFDEWIQNDRAVMHKNPDYWQDGKPYLDTLTIRYISDPQTVVNAMLTGEVDMALRLNAADLPALEQDEEIVVNVSPTTGMDLCYFNFSREPFNNRDARLAINYAVDRDELNEGLWFGMATPTSLFLPAQHWAFDPEYADTFSYDPDRARQLLADAGFPDGFDIKGVAFDAPGQARKNEIIQAQLAEVGINMTFDVMAVSAAVPAFATDLIYDIFCSGTPKTYDPTNTANSLFSSKSFINAGKYASPGMDEALAASGESTDFDERAAAFSDVFRLSQEDALYVPLLNYIDITPTHERVGGFVPNLLGRPDLSFLYVTD